MRGLVALVVLLPLWGCSFSYEHNGVALGESYASVMARLGSPAQPLKRKPEVKLEEGERQIVRLTEDSPTVAYELYTFDPEGALKAIMITYRPEADEKAIFGSLLLRFGGPHESALGQANMWKFTGGTVMYGDLEKKTSQSFFFTEDSDFEDAEPVVVPYRYLVIVGLHPSHRFLLLGLGCLGLVLGAGTVLVFTRRLQGLFGSTRFVNHRGQLSAYRRFGFQQKLADLGATVCVFSVAGILCFGFNELELIDVGGLLLGLIAFGALAKRYMDLWAQVTREVQVEDPELAQQWGEWTRAMEGKLNLGELWRLSRG